MPAQRARSSATKARSDASRRCVLPLLNPGQASETCNNIDDDCDGEVDEAFYGVGNECFGCNSVVGVIECTDTETSTQCSTNVGGSAAPEEICADALDNDCDDETDEVACTAP